MFYISPQLQQTPAFFLEKILKTVNHPNQDLKLVANQFRR